MSQHDSAERWAPVKGCETIYEISNTGKVRKTDGTELKTDRRKRVWLFTESKKDSYSIANLVASHFVPNIDNAKRIKHVNGDILDHRAVNLRWTGGYEEVNGKIMKRCCKCDQLLDVDRFYSASGKDGRMARCILCNNEQSSEYKEKNPEVVVKNNKEYYRANKEEERKRIKAWIKDNTDTIRKQQRVYWKWKMKTDVNFKLAVNIRGRIIMALKKETAKKSRPSEQLIGCSFPELRAYLESKFLTGMTWKNHGIRGWHIDHIVPCASFDLTDPEQQRKCFHYSNLQPLWAADNLSKNKSLDHPSTRKALEETVR